MARECEARGLHVLSVTTTPSAWNGTSALAPVSSKVKTALGLHPQLAHQRKSELGLFETLVPGAPFVGEIGLDGAPEFKSYSSEQLFVFGRILDICQACGGRVMSIHSRRAATAVLNMLEEKSGAGTPILHWFSGSVRELSRAVALGCWFSVGPAMLASTSGRTLISHMPRERILTESDGPFAQLDGRSAFPWDVHFATKGLAGIWREPEASVEALLLGNLMQLTSS